MISIETRRTRRGSTRLLRELSRLDNRVHQIVEITVKVRLEGHHIAESWQGYLRRPARLSRELSRLDKEGPQDCREVCHSEIRGSTRLSRKL